MDATIAANFAEHSRIYLLEHYLPKIRRCLRELTDEDVWWRPNPQCNSIANLVLHVCGNIRQWIVSGVGGEPDARHRQAEFDARGGATRDELDRLLETTLRDVERVLRGVAPADLLRVRQVQGQDVSGLEAVYHAVEHFSMHTGQIIYLTKMRTGRDLGFYRVENGIASQAW